MIQIDVAQEILRQMEQGECKKALLIEAKTIDLKFIGVEGIGKIYDVSLRLE